MATILALDHKHEASQVIYTACYCVVRQKRFLISRFVERKSRNKIAVFSWRNAESVMLLAVKKWQSFWGEKAQESGNVS